MSRDCSTCIKNGDQAFYSCGYLEPDKRRKFDYFFPASASTAFTLNICPVWYYRELIHIYKWYNLVKNSTINLIELSLTKRTIYSAFSEYLNQRSEYILDKERSKNGDQK